MTPFKTIDQYISAQDPGVQEKLHELRVIITKAAPGCQETISYGMPAFKLKKILVYFAAYKHHIGFYPTGEGIKAFEHELSNYKWSKGAIQFALDKKLPKQLITKIVKYKAAMSS